MKIVYTKTVIRDVRKVKDRKLMERIEKVIVEMKTATGVEELKQTKKMKGHPTAYRMRVGNYRLGFYLQNDTVELARFVKQNDIYKVFP